MCHVHATPTELITSSLEPCSRTGKRILRWGDPLRTPQFTNTSAPQMFWADRRSGIAGVAASLHAALTETGLKVINCSRRCCSFLKIRK